MSDLPNASPEPAAIGTAPPDPAPAVDSNRVVTSVVHSVQAHPAVAPGAAASVITSILASLYQAEPALFALSRASSRTQAEVSLGLGLAEAIVGAFLRPGS